jgi:hypothetical protein
MLSKRSFELSFGHLEVGRTQSLPLRKLKALLVEMKFNPCKIISHYCNNKFAIQYAQIHKFCPDSKHIQLCDSLKHQIHGYFI